MEPNFKIRQVTTHDSQSQLCMDSLWDEIQTRYEFQAPNPMLFSDFLPPQGKFFIAEEIGTNVAMGSAAYTKFSDKECELDVVYVFPKFRNKKVATFLLSELEQQSKIDGFTTMILRAGKPQEEALHFYKNFGFNEIPKFGKWVSDPTAICFEKKIK
ncbi:Acetyltransferase [Leptospira biflexa serovar Patoc strain 'Patoc 1 (Ames)']|uniref:Putative acetyltransferase n=1 Tax=Leptospira biflexa serovar Patoc (strain Patoc 1 / ATCC 23582 / Paris) TaxID=456481 RepID=B0SNT6_LEPBP|nr:GNAT family N-acetyltransferase [Leptospira biflexa]ABZ95258.1 Acetyltransferase [Leptospira biflexa serovar Patoc strain 'Patoc 1 (Ames)']ABZ98948.1 Putative acetyltransferase [Leptospira biflexa serovar Patoc strain 'Patoc 1 (Paris)']